MKNILFLTLMVLTVTLNASDVKLYKNYTFGETKDKIKQDSNVYDCSKVFEVGALCKDNETFVGENVQIAFRFIGDKLVSVMLLSNFTNENYFKFMGALNSKFQLVSMQSDDKKIDFIQEMKQYEKGVFLKHVTDFEQNGLSKNNITYTFIDKKIFQKLAKSSSNITDLLLKSNKTIREVDYIIANDANNIYGFIQFSAPKEALSLLKTQQKYEDF